MREGYKKTEVGVIPEDWEVGSFKDILKLRKESFNPNIEDNKKYIGLEHIEEKTGRLLGVGKSEETSSTKNKFYKGDVLFGKLRPYLKKYYLADFDGVCVTEILPLVPINSINKFCFYKIQEDKFIEYINNITFGTKMPRTSWNDIKDYKIAIPPLKEQEKIAEILSTVDSQIDDTEKLIKKSKELKKGLMQNLLTKGIGHSEFKKTEVGEIPASWEVVIFETLYEEKIRDFGSFSTTKLIEYVDEGIPYLRSENFRENNLNYKTVSKIPKSVDDLLDKSYVYKDNILFTKIGNIGSAYCYKGELGERCNSNATIAKIKVDEQKAINEYIVYFLISDICKKQYIGDIVSTPPRINMGVINKFKIILPPLKEQEKISEILLSIDREIKEHENKKQELEELKKGLMQQLLTGKIRVI